MKDEALQNISSLYDQKQEYMNDILKMTDIYRFKGVESEIGSIVEFIDKRQIYIDEIDKIDNMIKQLSSSNNIELSVFKKKRDDIKVIVDKLVQLDENFKVIMNKLFTQTGVENRKFLTRKAASIGYISGAANLGGSRFDTKK